jgi:hypothetical protein
VHAPSHAVAGLVHHDVDARPLECIGSGEAGEPSADDDRLHSGSIFQVGTAVQARVKATTPATMKGAALAAFTREGDLRPAPN